MAIINFKRPLILATASPARRALMADTGLKFTTQVVKIDESARRGEKVGHYVKRLALAKARAVRPKVACAVIIIAVDTAIGLNGTIIGKPRNKTHARAILKKLSGQTHVVASAIAVRDDANGKTFVKVTRTKVKFVRMDKAALDWYIGTGEWRNRAGAYAIQGMGAALIESVDGCFTNVIGMSVAELMEVLRGLLRPSRSSQ